jgi:hypothetical protein
VSDPIVAFFRGGGDAAGRTLDQILAWDDERLEAVHDYIQWLFPLPEPSPVNPVAPVVRAETVDAFARDATLRARLGVALDRMLRFYGLHRRAARIEIDSTRFPARAAVWLQAGNHNHLRLTRVMRSLATLGLRDDALALQRCLLEDVYAKHPQQISGATLRFWRWQ